MPERPTPDTDQPLAPPVGKPSAFAHRRSNSRPHALHAAWHRHLAPLLSPRARLRSTVRSAIKRTSLVVQLPWKWLVAWTLSCVGVAGTYVQST